MTLQEHERHGVFALLVRAIQASRDQEEAQRILQEAQERLKTANEVIHTTRLALSVFGFTEQPNLWVEVQDSLGWDEYGRAFDVAGVPRPAHLQAPPKVIEGEIQQPKQAIPDETTKTSSAGNTSIRDWILQYLEWSEAGVKAAEIREFLSGLGIKEMHEKTVGMTLNRLQKEGLVRRTGRVWKLKRHADGKLAGSSSGQSVPAKSSTERKEDVFQ